MRRPMRRVLMHIAPVGAEQEAPLGLAQRGEIAQSRRRASGTTRGRRSARAAPTAAAAASTCPIRTRRRSPALRPDRARRTHRGRRSAGHSSCRGLRRSAAAGRPARVCGSAMRPLLVRRGALAAAMAGRLAALAIVGVGADEHAAALVVGDDFVEIGIVGAAQRAGRVEAVARRTDDPRSRATPPRCTAGSRRCASRGRRRTVAAPGNRPSSDCRISASATGPSHSGALTFTG